MELDQAETAALLASLELQIAWGAETESELAILMLAASQSGHAT